jgi:hypothetical protein
MRRVHCFSIWPNPAKDQINMLDEAIPLPSTSRPLERNKLMNCAVLYLRPCWSWSSSSSTYLGDTSLGNTNDGLLVCLIKTLPMLLAMARWGGPVARATRTWWAAKPNRVYCLGDRSGTAGEGEHERQASSTYFMCIMHK